MWKDLSLKDKSALMQIMVNNGIYDLSTIRDTYNKFAEGGKKNSNDNWTMQDEVNYRAWRNELPDNLKYTDDNEYDMRGAYKAGMTPQYIKEDNRYHLGSRDPQSGKILKAPHHPTFLKALITDASMGYYPSTDNKGNTYTTTWIGNKFDEGGPKDDNINEEETYFGLTTDDWKDVGLGMIPVVGTYRDLQTFKEDPTLVNGLGLGISAATDAATLFGVGALAKGSKALYKAYKAKQAINSARQLAARQATNTYKRTRLARIEDKVTNKQVKSSIQSMLAKRQNALLAKQKVDFANTLFLDYTKRGIADTTKQIANPLKVDTGVNVLQNWWNTNL